MPRPQFIAWLVLEVLICSARLLVLLRARTAASEARDTPTDLYLVLGLCWACSVGYGTFISMISGDWVIATLACVSSAAMVGGICFRNFGAPRFSAAMILLSLGPVPLGALFAGEPILWVTLLQTPLYLFSMTASGYRLNSNLVSTMRSATGCCRNSPNGSKLWCARMMPPRGSAATSSWCSPKSVIGLARSRSPNA
jgi:hypothetical protein